MSGQGEGKFFWGFCCGASMTAIVTIHSEMLPGIWAACLVGHIIVKGIDHLSPRILPTLQAKSAALPRKYVYGPLALVGLVALWPAVITTTLDVFAGIQPSLESVVLNYMRLYEFLSLIVPVCGLSFIFLGLFVGLGYWIVSPSASAANTETEGATR